MERKKIGSNCSKIQEILSKTEKGITKKNGYWCIASEMDGTNTMTMTGDTSNAEQPSTTEYSHLLTDTHNKVILESLNP